MSSSTSNQSTPNYMAFISYRHADNTEEDRQWATWLHQQLEIYDVPHELIGQTNLRGEVIPERIYPVFRDEVSLPADADLSSAITKALDHSQFLVVLCSPRAVQSRYVNEEILHFKKSGREDRIMAALILGEPNASIDDAKTEDPEFPYTLECFPPALQYNLDERGELVREKPTEPIAANFRLPEGKGLTNPAVYKQQLLEAGREKKDAERLAQAYEEQITTARLKIIAGILGVPLEQLTERDKAHQLRKAEREKRRARRFSFVVSILLLVALIGGGIATQQYIRAQAEFEKAETQRNLALLSESRNLANHARQQLSEGNTDLALLLTLNGMPGLYGGDRPINTHIQEQMFLTAPHQFLASFPTINSFSLGRTRKEKFEVSPDGQSLLVLNGLYAELWSLESAQKLKTFEHDSGVLDLNFSPDGESVITVTGYETAIWSASSGEKLYEALDVGSFAFHPDGTRIMMVTSNVLIEVRPSGEDSKMFHWHGSQGSGRYVLDDEARTFYRHSTYLESVSFSPDGLFGAIAARDGSITIWEIQDDLTHRLYQNESGIAHRLFHNEGYPNYPLKLIFSPNGKTIISQRDDGRSTAILWSLETGEKLRTIEGVFSGYSPDGESILVTRYGNAVGGFYAELLTVESDEQIAFFQHSDYIESATFSVDGSKILTSSSDKTAVIWSAETGQKLKTFYHPEGVYEARFNADDSRVLTSSFDEKVRLWSTDISDREPLVHIADLSVRPNAIMSFSSDGSKLLTMEYTSVVISFLHNGEVVKSERYELDDVVVEGKISSNGERFLTQTEKTTTVWSLLTGEKLRVFQNDGQTYSADLSPDGQLALIKLRNVAEIWSVESGAKLKTFDVDRAYELAQFGSDGQSILFSSGTTTEKFSLVTGEKLYSFKHPYQYLLMLNHDDSRQVIINGDVAEIWSPESSERIQIFHHDTQNSYPRLKIVPADIWRASFSDNGRFLVTVAANWTTVVWSITTGEKVKSFHFDTPSIAAEFAPGSDYLFVDGLGLNVWEVPKLDSFSAEEALKELPINRTCLTSIERDKFFLPPLTDQQWIDRGCPEFTSAEQNHE